MAMKLVGPDPQPEPQQQAMGQLAPPPAQQQVVQRFMELMFAAFSERAQFMLNMLFTAGGLVLVWFLWSRVLPSPSVPQLIGVGMYSVFFLALEYVRRR